MSPERLYGGQNTDVDHDEKQYRHHDKPAQAGSDQAGFRIVGGSPELSGQLSDRHSFLQRWLQQERSKWAAVSWGKSALKGHQLFW
jgi:hypothetical protein